MKIQVQTIRGVVRFRRAGLEFGPSPIELDTDKLKKAAVDAIAAEPRLIVAEVKAKDKDKNKDKKAKD